MDENLEQLAFCRTYILPIWERWTDGNVAARELLECASEDVATRVTLVRRLLVKMRALHQHDADPTARAALAAGSACYKAYIGGPEDRFAAACRQAMQADGVARQEGAI